jgi:dolichyl-phosphate-mannose-protein mannosyltransferase
MPRTFWESDELLFAGAIRNFDPWSSHPHPPGYPLYVGLGKLFNLVAGDPFLALRALSTVSCVVGFLALSALFRRLLDDDDLAVCGALLFYFSSAVLVHGTLPLSDSPALMFIALMLLAATHFPAEATQRTAIGLGLAASAAIGTRPQLAIVIVPLLIALLLWTRDVRKFAAGIIAFGVLSMAWFAPLMDAAGGWTKLMMWETRQATYVAQHDAAASRGASSAGMVVSRFIAHPWGPKWLALPIFAIALLGILAIARMPKRRLFPIAFFSVAYFIVAVAIMDPADAARYSMPHMIGIALLVAAGLRIVRDSAQLRVAPYIAVAAAAVASFAYTAPIVRERAKNPSPPIAAARFIESHFPPNAVVAYDLSMRPYAEELLGGRFATKNVEIAVRTLTDAPSIPLVLLADGGTRDPDATSFSWPDSDAYGKLTRNHYRVVSVDPIMPAERFVPVSGVYALERNAQGEEWRWLAQDAVIRLPRTHGASVALTMQLSHDAPYETNDVRVLVNGVETARANIGRNPSTIDVALPPGPCDLRIAAGQSFSPANVLHNQDPRILAVQLLRLSSRE